MQEQEPTDLREAMVAAFIEGVAQGTDLVVVVSDSTSTSKIAPFAGKYPDRVVNVGIAEQNLVGVAVGLSLGGFTPFTCNAAPFLVARANEQIKNDVCYSNTNVKLVGLNAGICYGPLASTHHAIDDISMMRGLGNILILAPSDPVETREMFRFAFKYKGPIYIRMDSAKFPVLHDETYRFGPGKVDVLRGGNDVTICAVGSVVCEAYEAARDLAERAVDAEVLNVSSIRPVKKMAILESIVRTAHVVTVEEHVLSGGLGSLVSEIIAEGGLRPEFRRLGIPEGEFAVAGPREQVRAHYGIDRAGIVRTVMEMVD